MITTINDILTWIESPESFKDGVGTLDSHEKITDFKKLLSDIISRSSEKWDKLKSSELEKTFETLSNISKRIISLREHFEHKVVFLENKYYEINVPHPYDVFPPKGIDQAELDRMNNAQAQREQQLTYYINQNKQGILNNINGYVMILLSWHSEVNNRLIQVKRMLDKTYIENNPPDIFDSDSQNGAQLKPVNKENLKAGLKHEINIR
jgi:hypothetical protein